MTSERISGVWRSQYNVATFIQQVTQEGVLYGIAYPLKQCYQLHKHWPVFIKAKRLVFPNGRVTPEIYSTIAIAWTIAWDISYIVIAVVGPITSVNVSP